MTLGEIPMPTGFRYKKVYARGRPQHDKTDAFRIRHPGMAVSKRAKIFAPFDALAGFGEAVREKDELYESRRELSEEEQSELDCRMKDLRQLVMNDRANRRNRVTVSVTYFVPCEDVSSDSCGVRGQFVSTSLTGEDTGDSHGVRGQYRTISGICSKADALEGQILVVADQRVRIQDIYRLEILP